MRHNPFFNVVPGEQSEWVDWPPALTEQVAGHFRLELVGARGAGKSTLLRAVQARLAAEGREAWYMHLAPGSRLPWPPPARCEALLVDEADREAPVVLRRALERWKGSVLLAPHSSRRGQLGAAGEGLVSLALEDWPLHGWVERRVQAALLEGHSGRELLELLPVLRALALAGRE